MSEENQQDTAVVEATEVVKTEETKVADSDQESKSEEKTVEVAPYERKEVNVKSLLGAGAHFGHSTDKWNPCMMPYIYGERKGVHIINLDLTLDRWAKAKKAVSDVAAQGGTVLFVGTKQQAGKAVAQAAARCDSPYVDYRWLGGTLSNFQTIRNSLRRMAQAEELLAKSQEEGSDVKLAKKERVSLSKQLAKLETNLGGIREMKRTPDLVFIVDINKESIAVNECRKLMIPIVALVDTNVDPRLVDYPIPSNDDAQRTISLFVDAVADAVADGKASYEANREMLDKKRRDRKAQEGEQTKVVKKQRKGANKKQAEASVKTEDKAEKTEVEAKVAESASA